jgi:hypothetical protein
MANQDDRLGVNKILHNLLIKRAFLRYAFAFVMSFLAVNQVPLEPKRVVGLYADFVLRHAAAQVVIDAGDAVVDDYNHSSVRVGGRFPGQACFSQKFAQPRNRFGIKIVAVAAFEQLSLRADFEKKLVVSVGLNLADLPDQVDYGTPAEVTRKFAADKMFQQLLVVVSQVCTHAFSIAPRQKNPRLVFHRNHQEGLKRKMFARRHSSPLIHLARFRLQIFVEGNLKIEELFAVRIAQVVQIQFCSRERLLETRNVVKQEARARGVRLHCQG